MSKSKVFIEINGTKRQILNKYVVPPDLYDEYLEYGAIITTDEGHTVVNSVDYCPLCERKYEDTSRKVKVLCHRRQINKYYGAAVVICLDCRSYIEYTMEDDQRIIASIKQLIDSGFRPKNIYKFE